MSAIAAQICNPFFRPILGDNSALHAHPATSGREFASGRGIWTQLRYERLHAHGFQHPGEHYRPQSRIGPRRAHVEPRSAFGRAAGRSNPRGPSRTGAGAAHACGGLPPAGRRGAQPGAAAAPGLAQSGLTRLFVRVRPEPGRGRARRRGDRRAAPRGAAGAGPRGRLARAGRPTGRGRRRSRQPRGLRAALCRVDPPPAAGRVRRAVARRQAGAGRGARARLPQATSGRRFRHPHPRRHRHEARPVRRRPAAAGTVPGTGPRLPPGAAQLRRYLGKATETRGRLCRGAEVACDGARQPEQTIRTRLGPR